MISPQVAQHQFALFFHQSVHQANQLSSRRKTWNSELNPLPSLQLPLTLFSELMELLRDEIPPPLLVNCNGSEIQFGARDSIRGAQE